MGLALKAEAFLKEHAVLKDPCEHCGRNSGYVCKEIGRIGMFNDLVLSEYKLKDGSVAKEFVQHELWSSGPMIWVALEVDGEKFLWPESELVE
jgi:hypothetical protein